VAEKLVWLSVSCFSNERVNFSAPHVALSQHLLSFLVLRGLGDVDVVMIITLITIVAAGPINLLVIILIMKILRSPPRLPNPARPPPPFRRPAPFRRPYIRYPVYR